MVLGVPFRAHFPLDPISYLRYTKFSGLMPYAVYTGDTLFIEDVGRPDLIASGGMSAETLAGIRLRSGCPGQVPWSMRVN